MYPHERSLVKQLADKPFALIGVNSDRNLETIRETVKEKNITWRSFQNEEGVEGTISDEWGIEGWPTLFLIDAEGKIRWTGHSGDFDSKIEELLKEIGHEVTITHKSDEEDDDEDDDDKDEDKEDDDDDKEEDAGDDGR